MPTVATWPPPSSSPPLLTRAIPNWLRWVVGGVAMLLIIALVVSETDWANGAKQAGIAASFLALLVVLATVVRTIAGKATRTTPLQARQFLSTGIIVAVLAVSAGAGLGLSAPIHRLQAHVLEAQQNWQQALTEYALAGEAPPSSDDLARTYNEWGEKQSARAQYGAAIMTFAIVLDQFDGASQQVTRAQSDTVTAYLGWGHQATQQQDYQAATQHYDALLALSYCDANCQSTAKPLDATAYYDLAQADYAKSDYQDAVTAYQALVSRFPTAPEVQLAHEGYAQALLGLGKQLILQQQCSSALPDYQQLASQFKDTPEGKTAAAALKAPQPVTGQFTIDLPPSGYVAVAFLVKGINQALWGNLSTDQFTSIFQSAPAALIHSDGSFTFKPVKQGTYDLAWCFVGNKNGATDSACLAYFYNVTGAPYNVAKVGPLCPFDFGQLQESVVPPGLSSGLTAPGSHQTALITMVTGARGSALAGLLTALAPSRPTMVGSRNVR
jgi:tetratricopeptide (TPR) repeat protein